MAKLKPIAFTVGIMLLIGAALCLYFSLRNLSSIRPASAYDTPEDALEPYGWQFEEYCDEELDDFIAPPAEIRKLGIKIKQVKYYTSHDEEIKIFICYDEVRNIFFIGNVENKEIDLYAIYRTGTEDVFLQEENTH